MYPLKRCVCKQNVYLELILPLQSRRNSTVNDACSFFMQLLLLVVIISHHLRRSNQASKPDYGNRKFMARPTFGRHEHTPPSRRSFQSFIIPSPLSHQSEVNQANKTIHERKSTRSDRSVSFSQWRRKENESHRTFTHAVKSFNKQQCQRVRTFRLQSKILTHPLIRCVCYR